MIEYILSMMFRQSGCRFSCTLLALVIAVAAKPPPSPLPSNPSPWTAYGTGKLAYGKSLGPPGGLDTITVPYVPKISPFFPKFVDPKAMISSKTDFLSNLFGGMGPVNYPFTAPVLYASGTGDESSLNDISDLNNIISTDKSDENYIKRSAFSPISDKFGPSTSSNSPFTPKFMSGFNFPFATSGSTGFNILPRQKRSIPTSESISSTNFGPPPPYPGLSTIFEESENDTPTSAASASIPKQFLPGFFGPFGPLGPISSSPMIDPNFFASKKTTFLNTLFSNLATSTPATPTGDPTVKNTIVPPGFWSPIETATAIPVPKSTIVPPNFWIPSSIIPEPGEYTNKVTTFLDKLIENIKLNKIKDTTNETTIDDSGTTASKTNFVRSLTTDSTNKTKITNSIDDLATITAAKDAIVDSIIAELASLKTDMINNLDGLIIAEQLEVAKASAAAAMGKKPLKPFKAAFAGLWGPPSPSSSSASPVDPALPFKQKMNTLSDVFDMLTELQKNITVAVTDAIKSRATAIDNAPSALSFNPSSNEITPETYNNYMPSSSNAISPLNMSLLDAIKSKLVNFDEPTMNYVTGKYTRALTKGPKPLWSTYAQSSTIKRHVDNDNYDFYNDNQRDNDMKNDFKREVKMTMHQGYQSMPPGTIESVQAGGGSVPGHQGGGIKLLIQMPKSNTPEYK